MERTSWRRAERVSSLCYQTVDPSSVPRTDMVEVNGILQVGL